MVAPLCAGAVAGGLYQAWLPQLKGTVKADTNPFSTNALAATSIEQEIKSGTSAAAGELTLGQDTKSTAKEAGKAVKSALGLGAPKAAAAALAVSG